MELGIKGKKAVVTGGATGIGKAIALALAHEGVQVSISSRNDKTLQAALAELGGSAAGHHAVQCNITDEDGPTNLCRRIKEEFGHPDIVVNNVGDTLGVTDPFCPISDWRRIFRLNVEVHVEVNNSFIPYMREQRWGRILNVSAGASLENRAPCHTAQPKPRSRPIPDQWAEC